MAEDGESAILVIESGLNEMARAIININKIETEEISRNAK
jgi:hypothetical protein